MRAILQRLFCSNHPGIHMILWINLFSILLFTVVEMVLRFSNHHEAYHLLLANCWLIPLPRYLLSKPWTLFSYSYLHIFTNKMHSLSCFFDLFVLYTLGTLVEHFLGFGALLILYHFGAATGALFLTSLLPYCTYLQPALPLWGFSSSLYALLVALATSSPHLHLYLFGTQRILLKHVCFFYLLINLLALGNKTEAPSAVISFGSALWGYLYVRYLHHRSSHFLKQLKKAGAYIIRKQSKPTSPKEIQKKVDQLLDKIAKSGYQALTPEERTQLFEKNPNRP